MIALATKQWVKELIAGVLKQFGGGKEKYTTDEEIVGEWIDKRPIYRKVIESNITLAQSNWTYVGDIPDGEYVIHGDLVGYSKKRYISFIRFAIIENDKLYIYSDAYPLDYIIIDYVKKKAQ